MVCLMYLDGMLPKVAWMSSYRTSNRPSFLQQEVPPVLLGYNQESLPLPQPMLHLLSTVWRSKTYKETGDRPQWQPKWRRYAADMLQVFLKKLLRTLRVHCTGSNEKGNLAVGDNVDVRIKEVSQNQIISKQYISAILWQSFSSNDYWCFCTNCNSNAINL